MAIAHLLNFTLFFLSQQLSPFPALHLSLMNEPRWIVTGWLACFLCCISSFLVFLLLYFQNLYLVILMQQVGILTPLTAFSIYVYQIRAFTQFTDNLTTFPFWSFVPRTSLHAYYITFCQRIMLRLGTHLLISCNTFLIVFGLLSMNIYRFLPSLSQNKVIGVLTSGSDPFDIKTNCKILICTFQYVKD